LICGCLWWLVFRKRLDNALLPGRQFAFAVPLKAGPMALPVNTMLLAMFAVFLATPLMAIGLRGMPALWPTESVALYQQLLPATGRSLLIAIPAGIGAVAIALLTLAASRQATSYRLAGIASITGYLPLVVPPLVLGTGLFILLRPGLGNTAQGWFLVSFINGLMAVPFVLQVLRGPIATVDTSTLRQADQLGILGWYRWRWLYWPQMRRPIALGLAYGVALSLGDFGVIALFGSPGEPTLPVLLYQQLGSYRVGDAAGTGLWLLGLLIVIFASLSRVTQPKPHQHSDHVIEPEAEPNHA